MKFWDVIFGRLVIALVFIFSIKSESPDYSYEMPFVDYQQYAIDVQYLGYPATWGREYVDYMYAGDPAANMEAGPFIRVIF